MYVSQRTVMNWRCNILGHHLRRSLKELSHLFWGCWSSNDFESKCHDLRTFFQGLVANLRKLAIRQIRQLLRGLTANFANFANFTYFYFIFIFYFFYFFLTYFLNCKWQHETLFLKLLEVQTLIEFLNWIEF